jgi:hypothetical protein
VSFEAPLPGDFLAALKLLRVKIESEGVAQATGLCYPRNAPKTRTGFFAWLVCFALNFLR